jgi:hypothetical protein
LSSNAYMIFRNQINATIFLRMVMRTEPYRLQLTDPGFLSLVLMHSRQRCKHTINSSGFPYGSIAFKVKDSAILFLNPRRLPFVISSGNILVWNSQRSQQFSPSQYHAL